MSDSKYQLRTYVFIDQFQPQLACYIAKDNKVFDPSEGDACIFIEIAPAMEIHHMIDLALKATSVRLGVVITERQFGQLEVHHEDQGEVLAAGEAILKATNLTENDRVKCQMLTNTIIHGIEKDHSIALTNLSTGNQMLAGDSALIMECQPAAYMAYVCNEALKSANVKLNLITTWGATGRMILGGSEADIEVASDAAKAAIESIS